MTVRAADIAREFLMLVWESEAPDDAALRRGLDMLLARSHDVPPGRCAEQDAEPPSEDWQLLNREVAQRFPDYGIYPVADSLGAIGDGPLIADAVDDIADITRDLREVVWRDVNRGPEDAAWCFHLLHFHWADHARNLGAYLHARQSA